MTVTISQFQALLSEFRLDVLFNQFGWDRPDLRPRSVCVGDHAYRLVAFAQKRGVAALTCSPDKLGNIPPHADRLKIEREVEKIAFEHLLVFTNDEKSILTWQWVSREPGKPTALRTHTWRKGMSGESLRQKLESIVWSLEAEEAITLTDVIKGLRSAFDREKVTKRFFERFRIELKRFSDCIHGFRSSSSRNQYASMMLNRLMFIYFVQKKGFLDGDTCYLQHRFQHIDQRRNNENSHSYYRRFLRPLFHRGLNKPMSDRSPDTRRLIGRVPYFNGGLFDLHALELKNSQIDISDEAFDRLFKFFDTYDWHLDDRPLANDTEINPDVLGYIFEKYINQREKGAYYTKEDITGYICKNTVVSYILSVVIDQCKVAFTGETSCWQLLAKQPYRYIYPSQKKGIIQSEDGFEYGAKSLTLSSNERHDRGIVEVLSENLSSVPTSLQIDKNALLPRESERLFHFRRRRCLRLIQRLRSGQVQSVAAMITLNLDMKQFLQDIIDTCSDAGLLRAVWHALAGSSGYRSSIGNGRGITVLDPTCGSGAFLFAALSVLEPLYEACLDRMAGFVNDAQSLQRPPQPDFHSILQEVERHPSRQYFVYKSIMLNNLFGVDIMPEAAEVCKLRLFLRLVSQVHKFSDLEPLPDIDFNIRVGNALVGYPSQHQFDASALDHSQALFSQGLYAKLTAKIKEVSVQHHRFRSSQMSGELLELDLRKEALQSSACELGLELDRYLAKDYGIDPNSVAFERWRRNHQPFHWFAEFHDVFSSGGFDVVVGNPPYISTRNVTTYGVIGFESVACPDVYAWCLERVLSISHSRSWVGMIVPLSVSFSREFGSIRELMYQGYGANWFSHYGRIPAALFSSDVRVRNTIHIGSRWRGGGGVKLVGNLARDCFDGTQIRGIFCLSLFLMQSLILGNGWDGFLRSRVIF